MAEATTLSTDTQNKWLGGGSPFKVGYGKIMMWYFILSDAFTFASFLVVYGFIRFSHPAYKGALSEFTFSEKYWPVPEKVFNAMPFLHGMDLPLVFVGIMTFILILSSVTMVLAVEAGERMDKAAVEKWMLWTIIGGIAFLSCQAWEWSHFIIGTDEGTLLPDGTHIFGASLTQNQYGPSNFAALFFFITGFHGFHVFTGIVLNFIIFYQVITGLYQRIGNYDMVEKVGLYWHFVDLVWVFVFTFFYLV